MKIPKFKIGETVILEKGFIKSFRVPELYEVIGAFYWEYPHQDWRYIARKNKGWSHITFWEEEVL